MAPHRAMVGEYLRALDPVEKAPEPDHGLPGDGTHPHPIFFDGRGGLESWGVLRGTRVLQQLTGRPGVAMVAPFGTSLHVSGRDHDALGAAIAPYRGEPALDWKLSQPSLEDVFIELMAKTRDNFQ